MKLPEPEFDLDKYLSRRKKLREQQLAGERTLLEYVSKTNYTEQRIQIREHFNAIEKICTEHSVPISFSSYELNVEIVEHVLERATDRLHKLGTL